MKRLQSLVESILILLCLGPGVPAADAQPDYLEIDRTPGRRGGRLVAALSAEPQTFNPVTAADRPSHAVLRHLTGTLVELDHDSHRVRPGLAKAWTVSPDGRRIVIELRRGVRFSDGQPFDADDVAFTFQVFLDERNASGLRGHLNVGGRPVVARKLDAHTVEIELAGPTAEGVGLFDALPILPRHLLGEAQEAGRVPELWGTQAAASEMAGLGPFRLKRNVPGERIELERNPYYWKKDAAGEILPYLDELVFRLVPAPDAQVLRFQAGEIDLVERLSAPSFQLLRRTGEPGLVLRDLGPGLAFDFLFFNLNDVDAARLPEIARKQSWFGQTAFRQAIALAIDRDSIVRIVYQDRATPIASHVTPGNRLWAHPGIEAPVRAVAAARGKLEQAGFRWDDAGTLRDADGGAVTFTIVTNSSNPARVQIATLLQEDLRELGIDVRVAPLEFGALVDRLTASFDYEACILGLTGYIDPNHFMNVWRSDGNNHLWRLTPGAREPAWQTELDELMREQMTTLDHARRKRIYDRVQTILAEEVPYVLLVSPNVLVGARRGLGNFAPSVIDPATLWNADELYWEEDDDGNRP